MEGAELDTFLLKPLSKEPRGLNSRNNSKQLITSNVTK
jgi:hypothetical protein